VAFLEEEIFRTRERTGILIFLSLFEHRVVILGDEGINRRVEKEEWEGIVDDLVSGIRAGETVEGLVEAITRCGELLERRGVAIREDDADELRDHLRSRER
jgi:putative membrane protein